MGAERPVSGQGRLLRQHACHAANSGDVNHVRLSTLSAGYRPTPSRASGPARLSARCVPPAPWLPRAMQTACSTSLPCAHGRPVGWPSPDRRHAESGAVVPSSSTRMRWRKRLAHAAVSHPIKAALPKCDPGVLQDGLLKNEIRLQAGIAHEPELRLRLPWLCQLG